MAVTTTTRSVSYTATGAETEFAVPFRFLEDSHLVVELDGVAQALGIDYTVQGAGGSSGSVVPVASMIGDLVITRVVPLTQPVSFRSAGTFSPAVHEAAFDLATMQAQQIDEETAAASSGLDQEIVDRAAGDAAVQASALAAVAALSGEAHTADSLSSVLSYGTTTPRTLSARFSTNYLEAADFGVVADGLTGSAAAQVSAINSAITAAKAAGKTLLLPAGTIYLDEQISFVTTTGFAMEGNRTTLKLTGTDRRGSGTSVLHVGDVSNAWGVSLRDITLDANDLADYAGSFGNAGASPSSTGVAYRLVFQNAAVAGCRLVGAQGYSWYGCAFYSNTKDGLLIDSAGANTYEQFFSCNFSGNGECGVHIKRGTTLNFFAPLIDGNGSEGILIDGYGITQNVRVDQPYMENNGAANGKKNIQVVNTTNTTVENVEIIRPSIGVGSGVDTVTIGGGTGPVFVKLYEPVPKGLAGQVLANGWLEYKVGYFSSVPDPATNWSVAAGGAMVAFGSYENGGTPGFFVGASDGVTALSNYQLGVTANGVTIGGSQPLKAWATDTRTWDPPSIAAGGSTSLEFTFSNFNPGAGDHLLASFSNVLGPGLILQAEPTGASKVKATITNTTGSPVDLASGTLRVSVIRF